MLNKPALRMLLEDVKANFTTEYSPHQQCRVLTQLGGMNIKDEAMLEIMAN